MRLSTEWLPAIGTSFGPAHTGTSYADLRHYTTEFRDCGSGPPLVLIPGLAGGIELLGPLVRQLARRFRVISYQLRGEGDCFALRRRFALSDLVEDLAEFIDWHHLESPLVFGVSFGGLLAFEYGIRYPARLSHLIVQGAGDRLERGLLQRVAGAVLNGYPLPTDSPFINQFFKLLFGGRQEPGPLFEFVTQCCWQTDQSVMAHRFRMAEQFEITSRLSRVRVPTLILAGDRDLLVSARSLERLTLGLPRCQVNRLTGCGHLAFLTKPERIAEATIQFFNASSTQRAAAGGLT